MNDSEAVAECEGVWRTYGEGVTRADALAGVELSVRAGEFVAIVGPSGSGKSTLLNLLGALDLPTRGRVRVGGQALDTLDRGARADLRLARIGFVFQAYNLIPVLSARENVEFILQLQRVAAAERRRRALQMLADLGLEALAERRPGELSGGQQQRVAVARAMVTRPMLLLADEPSANLDSATTRDLLGLVRGLNAAHGTTVITATHDPEVMAYAPRRLHMLDGRVERAEEAAA